MKSISHSTQNIGGSGVPANLSFAQSYFQKQLDDRKGVAGTLEEMAKDAPRASKQLILGGLLRQIENMDSMAYSPKTWNALMKAYAKAKAVMLNKKPSAKDLQKATALLRAALSQLEQAERRKEEDEERDALPLIIKNPTQSGGTQGAPAAAAPAAAPAVEGASVDVSV